MPKISIHRYQQVHDFLKHHSTGILSTVSEKGEPWGSAITFAHDEDFNFFFMTRSGTLKYKNIEANPMVALTIVDTEDQITVQAAGKISRVAAKDTIDVVFKKLAAVKPSGNPGWVPPVVKVHEGDYMILRLTPSSLQYADYQRTKSDPHESYIEKIIPPK